MICHAKRFGLVVNINQFLVWHKKFGPYQNILWPLEGPGISTWLLCISLLSIFTQCKNLLQFVSLAFMWVYAGRCGVCILWQFGLSSFHKKDTKLARFLAKTLQRKLLFCYRLSKSAKIWLSKLKSIWIFLILFLINLDVVHVFCH